MVKQDGEAAICARIGDGAKRYLGEAGWVHDLTDKLSPAKLPPKQPKLPAADIAPLMNRYRTAIGSHHVRQLARQLGLSPVSLHQLGIGWADEHEAYAFPMRAADGATIGIRLRNLDGRKWAVRGSRNGLFMPNLIMRGPLLICEGPTDTAAMLGLSFPTLGRPSCTGGGDIIVDILQASPLRPLTIVLADKDGPGMAGARVLANQLAAIVPVVKVIVPPAKDARAWVQAGASQEDIETTIVKAKPWRKNGLMSQTVSQGRQENRGTQPAQIGNSYRRNEAAGADNNGFCAVSNNNQSQATSDP